MNAGPRVDPELTLVIPTLRRPILRRMLGAVIAGDTWPARVVIVNQGRSTEIVTFAEDTRRGGLDVLYVPSESKGRSAGLNDGIARVETRFVAITDDDCLVAPDWARRLGERLRRHAPAIVTGRVDAREGEAQLAVVTSEVEETHHRPRLRFDRLSGGNMGMSLEVARRVWAFAEAPSMRTAEDNEYAYRTLKAGIPIVYARDAVVQHIGWRDAAQREDQYRGYGLSQGGFFGWYLRPGNAFIALRVTVHLMRALRRSLTASLRGDTEMALNGRAYVEGLLPGLRAGWCDRGRAQ